ncbi:FtsX-like permease family protein, partial [Methylomagnum sp.]
MRHDFFLAWQYLRHNKSRTVILIACLGLIGALPPALHRLLDEGERWMTARAAATPLLVGTRGSAVDLVLKALYFTAAAAPPITMAEVDRIAATGWADPLPVYARFRVHGLPVVGVSLDYFDFRALAAATGDLPAILGDCVLGSEAAEQLELKPGDSLPTAPDNPFDLAGAYPLKLRVAGVLAKSHSPDDRAIFVDLPTAWVIEGLGHGHTEQSQSTPQADAAFGALPVTTETVAYTEITPDNLASFHFHGDPATYPISAVIALPHDRKSAALLRGRYLEHEQTSQIVLPLETTRGLLQNIFRLSALFDGVLVMVGGATVAVVGLVFALSLRLRQREIETIHLLGCGRWMVARLVLAEILLIGVAAGLVAVGLLQAMSAYAPEFVRYFV